MGTLNIKEAATLLGKSVKTLQRWDREGVLKASRMPSGRRCYDERDVLAAIGRKPQQEKRSVVAYCRVSSAAQKSDLANQRAALEQFCAARGLSDVEYVMEIGGGLNFKRPAFTKLMDRVGSGQVATLVIAHRDRLVRFGFDWFEYFCNRHKCELLVMNQEQLSPEQEMVQDLMTIVHCFSSRLYGLRNYKKALKEALKP
jgi:predicted site-specific integrase-resolvase